MWVSKSQLAYVLKQHLQSAFLTEGYIFYPYHNGRFNVDCYSFSFNVHSPQYTDQKMIDSVCEKVLDYFEDKPSVVVRTDYDLLLVNRSDPALPSYYVWKGNSNQRILKNTTETVLACNNDQLYLYTSQAPNIDTAQINTNFATSGMVVANILKIVFTFSTA
jgi:hypothetical protein